MREVLFEGTLDDLRPQSLCTSPTCQLAWTKLEHSCPRNDAHKRLEDLPPSRRSGSEHDPFAGQLGEERQPKGVRRDRVRTAGRRRGG